MWDGFGNPPPENFDKKTQLLCKLATNRTNRRAV